MHTIAVEENLTNVRQALQDAGFRVTGADPGEIRLAQAVVISGVDINMMQMEDIVTRAPVIDATSLSVSEIVDEVRRRLG